jgi:hypothetical protein
VANRDLLAISGKNIKKNVLFVASYFIAKYYCRKVLYKTFKLTGGDSSGY